MCMYNHVYIEHIKTSYFTKALVWGRGYLDGYGRHAEFISICWDMAAKKGPMLRIFLNFQMNRNNPQAAGKG